MASLELPKSLIDDNSISKNAKYLYILLVASPARCTMSSKELAENCDSSIGSVKKWITMLKNNKYIEVHNLYLDNGGIYGRQIIICKDLENILTDYSNGYYLIDNAKK